MKRAIIVSGGTLALEVVENQITQGGYVIGVDRGIEFLDKHGMKLDYLVGDFDSVSKEVITKYKDEGMLPIREYNPVKDASDTEIAVHLAIELGYKEIVILGATGSRMDHVWANIQVLTIPFKSGVTAQIIDECNRIQLIDKNYELKKKESYGNYFSVFALGGPVDGLTITGAKYPLSHYRLEPYDSLSVSNQLEEEVVRISYISGMVILMESREI